MKKIIIKEANKENINEVIKQVEGRATARLVDYNNVIHAINLIENQLDIAKKDMIGIVADIDYNAQEFPHAYKYTPESTHVKLERCSSGWALVDIKREYCGKHMIKIHLTEDAKQAILSNYTTIR